MFNLLLVIIYVAFISLGLPDALLGAAWPTIYQDFQVPISYAGIISTIIATGTIVSSLQSDRLTRRFGTGKVTAFSVLTTAVALLGFSLSGSFWQLILWAIPYGLGAGSVDASINNYVAINYASRHMSWLHSFWGIGAALGPVIMGLVLSGGEVWNRGYWYIALFQFVLTGILLFSLPMWQKSKVKGNQPTPDTQPLSLKEVLQIPGAKASLFTFFCYCGIEQTVGLWASSYLVLVKNVTAETAATFASLLFIGIAVGRGLSGFLTFRFNDRQMVRIGEAIMFVGIISLLLPLGTAFSIGGLILIGLGCAPIYPSLIHATPEYFGINQSQAIIGIEMAGASIGVCVLPPVFGFLTRLLGLAILPLFLLALLGGTYLLHERLLKIRGQENTVTES